MRAPTVLALTLLIGCGGGPAAEAPPPAPTEAPSSDTRPLEATPTETPEPKAPPQTPPSPVAPTDPTPADRVDGLLAEARALPDDARDAKLEALQESAFRFFRGANDLYWADLGADARLAEFGGEGAQTWILGDAHPENVGTFDPGNVGTAADDLVHYDLNDFDEAVVADYQLDVWRMAVGIELAARAAELDGEQRAEVLAAYAEAYLEALAAEPDPQPEARLKGELEDLVEKAGEKRTRKKMLEKWTTTRDGARALDLDEDKLGAVREPEPLVAAVAAYAARLEGLPAEAFAVKSVAQRLEAGTSTLGTERYYVLIEGPSADDDDDVILDVKVQGDPAPWATLGDAARRRLTAACPEPGQRVATAELAMLGARASPLTGWLTLGEASFSVRPRSPRKDDLDLDDLKSRKDFKQAAAAWGRILATAHRRAASSPLADDGFAVAVLAKVGDRGDAFAARVREVAQGYADQTERDHAALCEAAGR